MIKAIALDVDGVLVTGKSILGEHWASTISEDLGIDYPLLREHFFDLHWDLIVTGKARLREKLEPVLAQHAPEVSVDRLTDYWFQNDAFINQQLLRDLAQIRAAGVATHLATNQEHERMAYLMNELQLAAHVNSCIYSAAIGHRKPAAAFYQEVLHKVRVTPREMLLVDNSLQNVRAASRLEWHAVQWRAGSDLTELVRTA